MAVPGVASIISSSTVTFALPVSTRALLCAQVLRGVTANALGILILTIVTILEKKLWEFLLDFGTALSFFGFLPQMVRTIRNRDTLKDISMLSQLIYAVCLTTFSAYAYINKVWITMIIDLIQLGYTGLTIFLILRADKIRMKT